MEQWVAPLDSLGYKPKCAAKSKGKCAKGAKGFKGDKGKDYMGKGDKGEGRGLGKDGRDASGRFQGSANCGALDHWARDCLHPDRRRQGAPARRSLNDLAEADKEKEKEKGKGKGGNGLDALDVVASLGGMLTLNADSLDIIEGQLPFDALDLPETDSEDEDSSDESDSEEETEEAGKKEEGDPWNDEDPWKVATGLKGNKPPRIDGARGRPVELAHMPPRCFF